MTSPEVDLVLSWHAALNDADLERLLTLSSDDVRVGGPRGSGSGRQLLQEWVARADIRLEAHRWYTRDGTVVVDQIARWRSDNGQLSEPQEVASVFQVHDGLVTSVIRYTDLATAFATAGLADPGEPPAAGLTDPGEPSAAGLADAGELSAAGLSNTDEP